MSTKLFTCCSWYSDQMFLGFDCAFWFYSGNEVWVGFGAGSAFLAGFVEFSGTFVASFFYWLAASACY